MHLTRKQQEIYTFLRDNAEQFAHPPTFDELCERLGLKSKGSLHKHIRALVAAGLVEPMQGRARGIRLVAQDADDHGVPFLGRIAAGQPIEALPQLEFMAIPEFLKTDRRCYVLQVKGDSMIEAGIMDGDYVVIEERQQARNGEIVVALIDHQEATLKRIEQRPGQIILHPANAEMQPLHYRPEQVQIQGVLVGQMRRYG